MNSTVTIKRDTTRHWIIFSSVITCFTLLISVKHFHLPRNTLLQLSLIWSLTVFIICNEQRRQKYIAFLNVFRRRPEVFWLLLLTLFTTGLLYVLDARHRYFHLVTYAWFASFVSFPGLTVEQVRQMISEISTSKWRGIPIVLTTLVIIAMVSEIGVRIFLVRSDYVNPVFKVDWYRKYWKVNELGYRDYPIRQNVPPGTKRILIVGDSFVAGAGISRLEDTFPRILAQKLGSGFTVNIVARPGWNTMQEWSKFQLFPLKPDILILSYVFNDVDYLIKKWEMKADPSYFTSLILHRSYVANILYYYIWPNFVARNGNEYEREIAAAYLEPDLWSREEFWLDKFVQYSRNEKCPLIVIAWPLLGNPKVDYPIHFEKVTRFFIDRHITVVDTSSMAGAAGAHLVVSRFDAHPNEKAHSIAARLLYDAVINHALN